MNICEYGCNQKSKFIFKNGKRCCSASYRSCPHQAQVIGKTRIGKVHTKETKQKIGNKSKERIQKRGGSYFKGKHHSKQTKLLLSQQRKGKTKPNFIPWNKGLTKNDDVRIARGDQVQHIGKANGMYGKTHSNEIKAKQRSKNINEGKWKGPNNPWYGKNRSGQNSSRFLTKKERTKWELFRDQVRSKSEQTYKKNILLLNPTGLIRGICLYHLDHIIPIWYGFKNHIDVHLLSNVKNLRLIYYTDNLKRYKTKLTKTEQQLLKQLKGK